jgi:hypothetical protein
MILVSFDITVITLAASKILMKVNLTNATVVSTSALLLVISISTIVAVGHFGSAFSQAPSGGNITASSPNATSMEANVTGANTNNTNQSAPTAANTTAANASAPNASLSS